MHLRRFAICLSFCIVATAVHRDGAIADELVVYPPPLGESASEYHSVTVNGQPVFVYRATGNGKFQTNEHVNNVRFLPGE